MYVVRVKTLCTYSAVGSIPRMPARLISHSLCTRLRSTCSFLFVSLLSTSYSTVLIPTILSLSTLFLLSASSSTFLPPCFFFSGPIPFHPTTDADSECARVCPSLAPERSGLYAVCDVDLCGYRSVGFATTGVGFEIREVGGGGRGRSKRGRGGRTQDVRDEIGAECARNR